MRRTAKPIDSYVLALIALVAGSSCNPMGTPAIDASFSPGFAVEQREAVSGLSYSSTNWVFTRTQAIAPLSPQVQHGQDQITGYTVSPALPAGLSLHATTGVISGTPMSVSSPSPYTIVAVNASGMSTSVTVVIEVVPAPPSALAFPSASYSFVRGNAILSQSPTSGGDAITACSASPAFPAGLSLSSACVLSGTPTAVASASAYTITASNAGGSATVSLTISVVPRAPSIAYANAPFSFIRSAAITDQSVTNAGDAVTSCAVSPALPAGLSLASDCTLSGTPTTIASAANYTVTATNAGGSGSTTVSIAVLPSPPAISYAGSPFTFTRTAAAGSHSVTNTGDAITSCAVSPALPSGLSLASNCALSGTPTVASAATNYTVTATNAGGSGSATVSIAVLPVAPAIAYAGSPFSLTRNATMTSATPTNSGDAITSCSVSPALPAGLSLSANCVLSGAPSALSAAANYVVSATNAGGTGSATISIAVGPGPATKLAILAPTAPNTGRCSAAFTIESRSNDDDASPFGTSRTVALASSASGPVFYSDSGCATAAASFAMSTSAQQTFYLRSNIAGSFTITASTATITSGSASVTIGMELSRIDTFSGGAEVGGYVDATGSAAKFALATEIATDGTNAYIADTYNNVIRKVVLATGVTTTLAGSEGVVAQSDSSYADGTGTAARFKLPMGIVYDPVSEYLYVSDTYNCAIRRVHPTTGETLTIAGSYPNVSCGTTNHATGTSAVLNFVRGLTVMGGALYVADTAAHRIRKVSLTAPYAVSTTAGNGATGNTSSTLTASRFSSPHGITNDGTYLYVADTSNNRIRKIDIAGDAVTTIAGTTTTGYINNATGTSGRFSGPRGIVYSSTHNALFVADYGNHAVRKVDLSSPTFELSTYSGTNAYGSANGGTRAAARYFNPWGLTMAAPNSGEMYLWEYMAKRLRKISHTSDSVTSIVGTYPNFGTTNGTASAARFLSIQGSARVGNFIYVSDSINHCIRRISLLDGAVTTYSGACGNGGSTNGALTSARYNSPQGLLYDGTSKLYVADSGNNRVRVIDMDAATVGTFIGSSSGNVDGHRTTAARLASPTSMAFNSDQSIMYIADSTNAEVKALTMSTDVVASWIGGTSGNLDGTGTGARFNAPQYIVSDGTHLYVTDSGAHNVRKVALATGVVTTLAGPTGSVGAYGYVDGTGSAARFFGVQGITYDGSQYLYVADRLGGAIRKIDKATGVVTSFAGTPGKVGEANGPLDGTERVYMPFEVLYTDSGLFVFGESNIRWIH